MNIHTMASLRSLRISLYKEFGVDAEILIDHAGCRFNYHGDIRSTKVILSQRRRFLITTEIQRARALSLK